MSVVREYIKSQLIEPMKNYPTTIQDTMLSIITDRIEELYNYSKKFPEIVEPNANRLDILQAILEQFQYSIRDDADIQEQLDILDNILYVYSKRGSVDTIRNMWKYYGGNLPKNVDINVPSYNLFRYSVSGFSGGSVYPDGDMNRPGVYEILLTDNTYPIEDLKEFMLKELVAAGTKIQFRNSISSTIDSENNETSYKYDVLKNYFIQTESIISLYDNRGMIFSNLGSSFSTKGSSSVWSGTEELFFEVTNMIELSKDELSKVDYIANQLELIATRTPLIIYSVGTINRKDELSINLKTSYTPSSNFIQLQNYLYDKDGNPITSNYPGYFVLSDTLLGSEVL